MYAQNYKEYLDITKSKQESRKSILRLSMNIEGINNSVNIPLIDFIELIYKKYLPIANKPMKHNEVDNCETEKKEEALTES